MSPDAVQASTEYQRFVQRLTNETKLVKNTDSIMTLEIGTDGWPFPIPLVNQNGQWFFDTAAGKAEILNRRIGTDEIGRLMPDLRGSAIEYASEDRIGDRGRMRNISQHPACTTVFSGRRIKPVMS